MNLEPVQIDFQAAGVRDVLRAFESIERASERAERQMGRSVSTGARERVTTVRREVDDRERAYQKMVQQIEREERASVKATERAASERERAQERETQSAMRQVEKLRRERERATRESIRLREQEAREAERIADRQARAEERAAEKAAAARRKNSVLATMGRSVSGMSSAVMGRVGQSVGHMASAAVSVGSTALALGGGFALVDSLRGGLNEEKSAVGLFNSLPTDQQGRTSVAAIQARGRAIQAGTHIDKAQAIEAMRAYVAKTGDAGMLAAGDDTAMQIAKLAKATDTDFSALMSSAGLMKAQNKGLTNEDMLTTLRMAAAQGKKGAVEISDLAQIGGKITATRGAFAMNQTEAQRQLLGLAQVVLPTAGSPDEAATVVSRFAQDALAHADSMPKGVVDKKTGLLQGNVSDIIAKALDQSKGNLGTLMGMGFKRESIKLFEQVAPTWREAFEGAGGDKGGAAAMAAGRNAVLSQINDVTASSMSKGEVDEGFARVMQEKSERIDAAMQRLNDAIETKGLPILERFIDKLPELMPKVEIVIDAMAKLASWITDNPFKAAIALMGSKIVADLAAAQIGNAVKNTLIGLLSGAGGGAGDAAKALTGGGGGSSAAGLLGAVGATAAILYSTNDAAGSGEEAGKAKVASRLAALQQATADIKSGKISSHDAQQALGYAQGELAGKKEDTGFAQNALDIASVPLSPFSEGARKNIARTHEADEYVKHTAELTKAMQDLKNAIQGQSATAQAGGSMADPSNPARRNAIPHQPTHQ